MDDILNYLADRIELVTFLVGIIFIITGLLMRKFPPKKINALYGYRTSSSMKSQQVWDFSQKYSADKMVLGGLFLFAVSFLRSFIDTSQEVPIIIGLILMIMVCIYMFFTTEKAIKKNFPNNN